MTAITKFFLASLEIRYKRVLLQYQYKNYSCSCLEIFKTIELVTNV